MNNSYTLLPENIVFNIDEHFPQLKDPTKKVAIFLSGGMESTLVAKIAQQVYKPENILYFFNCNMFTKDPVNFEYLRTNNKISKLNLGIETINIEIDPDLHLSDRVTSLNQLRDQLINDYDVEFMMWGFTKLFFQVEIFKRQCKTNDDVYAVAYSDVNEYHNLIEEIHFPTKAYESLLWDIFIPPEVFEFIHANTGFVRAPLDTINKPEVVDLYKQLGWLDLLAKTTSCSNKAITTTGKHCGDCFNCQQRHDAFKINGTVEDQTEYISDSVSIKRKQLEDIMKNDPIYNKN